MKGRWAHRTYSKKKKQTRRLDRKQTARLSRKKNRK